MSENKSSIGKPFQDGTVSDLIDRFGKDGAWKNYELSCKDKIGKLLKIFDTCDIFMSMSNDLGPKCVTKDGNEEYSMKEWCTKIYEVLNPFLNLTPGDKVQYITWLMAYMSGFTHLPILVIDGPKGCGKSTLCRITHAIVNTDSFCSFYGREKQPYEPVLLTGQERGKEMLDSILLRDLTIYENVTELNDGQISGMAFNTCFKLSKDVSLRPRGVILHSSGLILPDGIRDYCIRLEMPALKETKSQDDIMADLEQILPDVYKAATSLYSRMIVYRNAIIEEGGIIESHTERSKIQAEYLLTGICIAIVLGNVGDFVEQFQKQ